VNPPPAPPPLGINNQFIKPVKVRIENNTKEKILTNQSFADLFIDMSIPPNKS
jgi:hypothetical protein